MTDLLDVARAAFLEFGIKRTSMADIAKRAGISQATLYRKFRGKEALVQAVGLRELMEFLMALDKDVDREAEGADQIAQFCVAVLTAIRNHELLQRLLTTDPETLLPLMTVESEPYSQVGQTYVADILRDLIARGKIPALEVELVAEVVVRLTVSFVVVPHSRIPVDDGATFTALVRTAVATIERGMA